MSSPSKVPLPASPASVRVTPSKTSQSSPGSPNAGYNSSNSTPGGSRRRTISNVSNAGAGSMRNAGAAVGGSRLRQVVMASQSTDDEDEEEEDDEEEESGMMDPPLAINPRSGFPSANKFETPSRSKRMHDVSSFMDSPSSASASAALDSPNPFATPTLAQSMRHSRSHFNLASPASSHSTPFRSPSTPSGLSTISRSRSAITPFNMDRCHEDGQKATAEKERELRRRTMSGIDTPSKSRGPSLALPMGKLASWVGPTETTKKSRAVVRKRPLFERVSDQVMDTFDSISSDLLTLPHSFALPIAIFLQFIHLLARAPLSIPFRSGRNEDTGSDVFRESFVRGGGGGGGGARGTGGFMRSWFGSGNSGTSANGVFIDEERRRRRLELALQAEENAINAKGLVGPKTVS